MSLDWSVSEDAPGDDHPRCPRCNDVLLAITSRGPSDHRVRPCGSRVSGLQVRALRDGHTGTDHQADVDGGIDDEL